MIANINKKKRPEPVNQPVFLVRLDKNYSIGHIIFKLIERAVRRASVIAARKMCVILFQQSCIECNRIKILTNGIRQH